MTNTFEESRVNQILSLHNQILADLKRSLTSAIQIGELLTEQKQHLNHGEFNPWIKSNLPFTDRTARNYMRLYREKDRLKTETVSDLKSAYRLLTEPKPLEGAEKITHCYADLVNQVHEEKVCSWQEAFAKVAKDTGFPVSYLLTWHIHFFGVVELELQQPTKKDNRKFAAAFSKILWKAFEKGGTNAPI